MFVEDKDGSIAAVMASINGRPRGLLDTMWADPSGQAVTALAGGLLGVRRGNEGAAIQNALRTFQVAQESQRRNRMVDIQLEEILRKRKDDEALRGFWANQGNFMGAGQSAFPPNEMDPEGSPASGAVPLPPHLVAQKMLTSGVPALAQAGFGALQKEVRPPVVVGEGGALVDSSGRVIHNQPKSQQPPEIVRLAAFRDSLPPGHPMRATLDAAIQKATTHAPAASATIINKQETEEAKTVGKSFGEMYADLQKSGMAAQGRVNRLDRFMQLLDGVETGKLTPAMTELAGYAKDFGLTFDSSLDVKQAARQLSNEMALQMRNPAGGAGMPGALSDRDLTFLKETVPGLANTPGGNKTMVETSKRLAKREIEVAKLAREYRAKRGTLDEGFFAELEQFSAANPLFADLASASSAVPYYDRTGKRVR
jgi:hypothetical protein